MPKKANASTPVTAALEEKVTLYNPQAEDSRDLYEQGYCLVDVKDVRAFEFVLESSIIDPYTILSPPEKRADYDADNPPARLLEYPQRPEEGGGDED